MTASDKYPLPTVPEQVTASWLGKVLGQNVKSAELIYSVLNATASKLFFNIEYEDDKNAEDQARYVCIKGGLNPAMLAVEGYKDLRIFVTEGLNNAGFTFRNPQNVWSAARVKTGVEQLAALHASVWDYSYTGYPWVPSSYEGVMMALTDMWDA
ncbi:hypothetical protein HG530_013909 [Fusarium avenaceum]|nr:hypothetical protein HG530_013909 [Fusarium avenaceum]